MSKFAVIEERPNGTTSFLSFESEKMARDYVMGARFPRAVIVPCVQEYAWGHPVKAAKWGKLKP